MSHNFSLYMYIHLNVRKGSEGAGKISNVQKLFKIRDFYLDHFQSQRGVCRLSAEAYYKLGLGPDACLHLMKLR